MKTSLHRIAQTTFFSVFFALAFVAVPAGTVSAQTPPPVIINEFSSNGGSDWVELLNTTSSAIDLSGWYLVVVAGAPATTTLSGTLPANGILTFATTLDDAGAVINLNQGNTVIQSAAYGTAPSPVVTAPAGGESGALVDANAQTWVATSTPSKGWFNVGPAPSVATIVSGINGGGVTTNWGTGGIADSSAATGLYFEKTGMGRVTFSATLNLTDADTTTFLQNLGTYMESSAGSMHFDARTATQLKDAGAEIKLYGLDTLGYSAAPPLIVKDDTGAVIDGSAIVSGVSYAAGTLTFTAAHFTQFDVDSNIYVDASNGGSQDGSQAHPFATIQAGINATPINGTVHIAAGTYAESLTVNKDITVSGAGATTIVDPATDQNGFLVTAAGVTIQNLKITLQTSGVDAQAIRLEGANSVTLSGNTIETAGNKGVGIWVGNVGYTNSNTLTISNNTITIANESTGIFAEGGSTAQTGWSITGNTVTANSGNPLELYDVTNSTTSQNTLTTTGAGGANVIWSSELASLANLVFTNNILDGSNGSQVVIGTDVKDAPLDPGNAFTGSIATVTVTGNSFSNWGSRGLRVGAVVGSGTVTSVTAHNNQFLSTGQALRNFDASSVDATQNWWGSSSSTTVAGLIAGTVAYSPWWADSAMTELRYTTTSSGGEASSTVSVETASTTTTGAGNVTINIPAGTVVTGPDTWDGTINLPTATTTTVQPVADSGKDVTVVGSIEVGFGNTLLTFDKAVKLTFVGQAGNYIGYSHGAGTFHQITTVCADNTQVTNDLLAAGADCKIDVSGDLVVWTKHFSLFTTYTQSTTPPTSSGGGGGGGGPVGLFGTTNAIIPTVAGNTGTGSGVGTGSGTGTGTGSGSGGQVLGAETYNFAYNLGFGKHNTDVVELQKALIAKGFDIPLITKSGVAYGYFGSQTKAAVIKYQKVHGIPTTGFVGVLTRAQLNKGN